MSYRKTPLLFIIFIISQLMTIPLYAHNKKTKTLVLVSSIDNPVKPLKPAVFRKLFLNEPVIINNKKIRPILNTSDKLLYEIFLQKVVYMSQRHYERTLISKAFRTGRPRSPRFSNIKELLNELKSTPGSVSFMWLNSIEKEKNIYVIQTLWVERH